MSPHFSYSSLELERPSINQEGYALLALHPFIYRENENFQSKYVGNKKMLSQNIQICINLYDGKEMKLQYSICSKVSDHHLAKGKKKVIINLKSNDFVRDCYSSVFHFSLMSKWVDIFLDPIIVDEEIVSPSNLPTRRPREISEKRSH